MERRNYFELLNLPFDPPESNTRKIEKAIEEWKKNLEMVLANASDQTKQKAIQEELALYEDMKASMKENKTRNAEALALKKQRSTQLEQMIDIMSYGQTGTLEVTDALVDHIRSKMGLAQSTIQNLYTKKGWKLQLKRKKYPLMIIFCRLPFIMMFVQRSECCNL